MTTLVAGGAGFIGINLINKLSENDRKIYILDNFSINRNKSTLKSLSKKNNIKIIECDLSLFEETRKIIKDIKDNSLKPIF